MLLTQLTFPTKLNSVMHVPNRPTEPQRSRATRILRKDQLNNVKLHKYQSSGSSLLEPIFQKFWGHVIQYCPIWVAPNLITFIGFLCNVIPSILFIACSKGARDEVHSSLYLASALGLFIYQTLDAIDGKQARRTNSSSPLGELFDHGCDTIACVILTMDALVILRLGDQPWLMFLCFFSILAAFYAAHWQTYVTGKLIFGRIDVTEAQVSVMCLYIVCALTGSSFLLYSVELFGFKFRARLIPILILFAGSWNSAIRNILSISKGGIGRNGSSVANSSIVFPSFQFILIFTLGVVIAKKSNSYLYENNVCMYLLFLGIVWCKYTDRLIVATMSKSQIFLTDTILAGPLLLILNQNFNFIIEEHYLLAIAFCICLIDLVRYNYCLCQELCEYLDIRCFSLKGPLEKVD